MATTRDRQGYLTLGGLRLTDIAADGRVGTPSYVYDVDAIEAEARELESAFESEPHLVAYAVKANTAGPIVRAVAATGCGADVVSGAELMVARRCGIAATKIVFSGVAKSDAELDYAIAEGILAIQVESIEEIARVEARAASVGRRAQIAVRINPGVDRDTLDTHAHIATGHDEAKFGVPRDDVDAAFRAAMGAPHVELVGISQHLGSQFKATDGYLEGARILFDVARAAREAHRAPLRFVCTGGGFGIDYGDGCPVRPADFIRPTRAAQREARLGDLALNVEPGRAIVAAHGVLIATVIQGKGTPHEAPRRRWLMIDAGMSDLIRPALYQARHRIVPLEPASGPDASWRVVGPICESTDDFGSYDLPSTPPRAVAILDTGAYGYVMASRYNGRPFPAEVFLRGGAIAAVASRKPIEDWVDSRTEI
jgi:diaminopimelate decarboxylase